MLGLFIDRKAFQETELVYMLLKRKKKSQVHVNIAISNLTL